jgi:hypothetical protein
MINGTIAIDFDVVEETAASVGWRGHGVNFQVAPESVCRLYLKEHLT